MRIVHISEARKSLATLVEAAAKGERIGISRRGRLVAMITPPQPQSSLREFFEGIEVIRTRARKRSRAFAKSLINEGRI